MIVNNIKKTILSLVGVSVERYIIIAFMGRIGSTDLPLNTFHQRCRNFHAGIRGSVDIILTNTHIYVKDQTCAHGYALRTPYVSVISCTARMRLAHFAIQNFTHAFQGSQRVAFRPKTDLQNNNNNNNKRTIRIYTPQLRVSA